MKTKAECLSDNGFSCKNLELHQHRQLELAMDEYAQKRDYALNNLLDDTEEFLRHLEDFTHGRDGDTITELRHRINNFKKSCGRLGAVTPNNTKPNSP